MKKICGDEREGLQEDIEDRKDMEVQLQSKSSGVKKMVLRIDRTFCKQTKSISHNKQELQPINMESKSNCISIHIHS